MKRLTNSRDTTTKPYVQVSEKIAASMARSHLDTSLLPNNSALQVNVANESAILSLLTEAVGRTKLESLIDARKFRPCTTGISMVLRDRGHWLAAAKIIVSLTLHPEHSLVYLNRKVGLLKLRRESHVERYWMPQPLRLLGLGGHRDAYNGSSEAMMQRD